MSRLTRLSPAPPAGPEPRAGAAADSELFARRTARMLWILLPLTFAISLAFVLIAPSGDEGERHGSNTFSVSAVGYRGLTELLQKTGVPLLASQRSSGRRAGEDTPLVLLEPLPADDTADFELLLQAAEESRAPVIVVLPKWQYRVDYRRHKWVAWVDLHRQSVPSMILAACRDTSSPAAIVRPSRTGGWYHRLDQTAVSPSLARPQLISPEVTGIERLVWNDDGVLVGRSRQTGALIISDPDLLNNAGLAAGGNAMLTYHLLVEYFNAKALVFDETLHGFTRSPSLWREMLDPPLLFVVLHLGLVLAAVAWAAGDRFGRPLPTPSRIAAGVETLVDNTARLISLGGMVCQTPDEYWRLIIRRTARELAVPPDPGAGTLPERQARMLAKLARQRGVTSDIEQLGAEVARMRVALRCEPRKALALVRRLYFWRKEMVDGKLSDR